MTYPRAAEVPEDSAAPDGKQDSHRVPAGDYTHLSVWCTAENPVCDEHKRSAGTGPPVKVAFEDHDYYIGPDGDPVICRSEHPLCRYHLDMVERAQEAARV